MNTHIQNALSELKSANAQELPTAETIASAKDGTIWNGQKSNGDPWSLTKNNENSYSCMC